LAKVAHNKRTRAPAKKKRAAAQQNPPPEQSPPPEVEIERALGFEVPGLAAIGKLFEEARARAAELEKARKRIDLDQGQPRWTRRQIEQQIDRAAERLVERLAERLGGRIESPTVSIATETKSEMAVKIEATLTFLGAQYAVMNESGRGLSRTRKKEIIGRELHELLKSAARTNNQLKVWAARSIVLRMNEQKLW
jgi:hypothetical protein